MTEDELKGIQNRLESQQTAAVRAALKATISDRLKDLVDKDKKEKEKAGTPPAYSPKGALPVLPNSKTREAILEHNRKIHDRKVIAAETNTPTKKFNLEAAQQAAIDVAVSQAAAKPGQGPKQDINQQADRDR